MEGFLLAVVAVQCAALVVMYATNAHMLARIRRLEVMLRNNLEAGVAPGLPNLPRGLLEPLHLDSSATLHVVDPSCASCAAHLAALDARASVEPGRHHVVVADELAAGEIEAPHGVPVHVLPGLGQILRQHGSAPYEVDVTGGRVTRFTHGAELALQSRNEGASR